ncbi:hypothetical protein 05601_40 [Lactococcus phage 05601]|uniref:Uncharacterized protein n=1 Tax=Lactococcus phage 05601 TaxID=2029658 RepID=A0A343JNK9_9CAUD|nr:hypothetical protein HYP24_gp40 [Lactococcus phage 05601]ASZ71082.1 hypothetical protein 05601_40 [Lactococcus phage 05601]
MAHATFRERPPRTNAPMQPRNGEKKMELVECQTCGAHSMTNGKCDYCGNQYEVNKGYQDLYEDGKHTRKIYGKTYCDNGTEAYAPKENDSSLTLPKLDDDITFEHGNKRGDKVLTFMLYLLFSIVWFAVTVFIPPLFIITIILLVFYSAYRLINKKK